VAAINKTTAAGVLTTDAGGTNSTKDVAQSILKFL
jgi:isocitrate/isopropylmalate dehydrogenase